MSEERRSGADHEEDGEGSDGDESRKVWGGAGSAVGKRGRRVSRTEEEKGRTKAHLSILLILTSRGGRGNVLLLDRRRRRNASKAGRRRETEDEELKTVFLAVYAKKV